jgi:hypothetical protein
MLDLTCMKMLSADLLDLIFFTIAKCGNTLDLSECCNALCYMRSIIRVEYC